PFFPDDKFANNSQATTGNPTINVTVDAFATEINTVPESAGQKTEVGAIDKITPIDDQPVFLTYSQKTEINEYLGNLVVNDFGVREEMYKKTPVAIQGGNSAVEKNNIAINKRDIISAEDKAWV